MRRRPYAVGDIIRDYASGADWRVVRDGIDPGGQVLCEPVNEAARRYLGDARLLFVTPKSYRRRIPRKRSAGA